MAFVDHAIKLVTLLSVGAGDAVISKDASQHPVWIFGNVLRVVFDLRIVAGSLLIAVSTDSAVRRDSELWLLSFLDVVPDLTFGWYESYICHQLTSLSIWL
jgi:hypothetical protein